MKSWFLCLILVGMLAVPVAASSEDQLQRYPVGYKIPLFVDTVVPYHNPSESYRYYSLKFCRPVSLKYKRQSLAEVLQGSEKMYSPYDIRFRLPVPKTLLCNQPLQWRDVRDFRRAVQQQYYFQWWFDEIPVKAAIGEVDLKTDDVYLFTHFEFVIEYNMDRVIEVRLAFSRSHRTLLPPPPREGGGDDDGVSGRDRRRPHKRAANAAAQADGAGMDEGSVLTLPFTYAVQWRETDVAFSDRSANRPRDLYDEEVEIQWYSIMNSFLLVVLLTGFMAFIVLRILRKDYQRYAVLDDPTEDVEESGWKMIHADVFRFPTHRVVFCSVLGVGTQLLLLMLILLSAALGGAFNAHSRGTVYAAVIFCYCLTSMISGYVSGFWCVKLEAGDWVHTAAVTVLMYPVPVFVVWSVLNTISWRFESTQALPFDSILSIFASYFLATFPLTLAGAILAKNTTGPLHVPCRTRNAIRAIPPVPWYRGPVMHVFVAGFLPFSAIYVELYYVYISIWGHQLYTPYAILYMVFIILLMVTSSITVALTYLQLSMENHQWWGVSVVSGGATAFFVYLYCFYFLFTESEMSGLIQLTYYFGYMALICYGLFLVLGTVGFVSSFLFVLRIYESIKSD